MHETTRRIGKSIQLSPFDSRATFGFDASRFVAEESRKKRHPSRVHVPEQRHATISDH